MKWLHGVAFGVGLLLILLMLIVGLATLVQWSLSMGR
jgi:hypothetical protein